MPPRIVISSTYLTIFLRRCCLPGHYESDFGDHKSWTPWNSLVRPTDKNSVVIQGRPVPEDIQNAFIGRVGKRIPSARPGGGQRLRVRQLDRLLARIGDRFRGRTK